MILHLVSTLVVALVALGLWQRRTPAVHMRFMTAAFLLDLGLVLYIEGTRHAVEAVAATGRPIVWFHALVSTTVIVLYVAQLSLGRRLRAGRPASRSLHIGLGLTFCLMRGLNYATAFVVASPASPAATIQAAVTAPATPPAAQE